MLRRTTSLRVHSSCSSSPCLPSSASGRPRSSGASTFEVRLIVPPSWDRPFHCAFSARTPSSCFSRDSQKSSTWAKLRDAVPGEPNSTSLAVARPRWPLGEKRPWGARDLPRRSALHEGRRPAPGTLPAVTAAPRSSRSARALFVASNISTSRLSASTAPCLLERDALVSHRFSRRTRSPSAISGPCGERFRLRGTFSRSTRVSSSAATGDRPGSKAPRAQACLSMQGLSAALSARRLAQKARGNKRGRTPVSADRAEKAWVFQLRVRRSANEGRARCARRVGCTARKVKGKTWMEPITGSRKNKFKIVSPWKCEIECLSETLKQASAGLDSAGPRLSRGRSRRGGEGVFPLRPASAGAQLDGGP